MFSLLPALQRVGWRWTLPAQIDIDALPLLILIGMCTFAAIDQLLMWRATQRSVTHLWACGWATVALAFMFGRLLQRVANTNVQSIAGGRLQIAAALLIGPGAVAGLRFMTGWPKNQLGPRAIYAAGAVLIGVTLFSGAMVTTPVTRYVDAIGVDFLAAGPGPLAPLLAVYACAVGYLNIQQMRRDHAVPGPGRRLFAAAMLFLLLTIFNDVLQLMRAIHSVSAIEYGLAAMLVVVAHVVKLRVAALHADVERTVAQLEDHKRKLEEALENQRRMQATLLRADRLASLGTLAAGTAHEINNPLTYIVANIDEVLERLRTSSPGADTVMLLEEARGGCQRVSRIVRDLETLSSVPTHQSASCDVASTLTATLDLIKNEVRHRGEVQLELADTALVALDEGRLGQVFLNLLINAAHALESTRAERPLIVVRSEQRGDEVTIDVIDNGPGIPADIVGRVFDPFFTTKPQGLGTGLGLSVCHGIVTEVGGTIVVISPSEGGTQVRLTLPVAPEATPAPMPPSVESAACTDKRSILIVDDEPIVARALRRMLREHDVVVVESVADALLACDKHSFDAVLCDLMMPSKTGMDLHRELLTQHPALAPRMVFVTGGAFTNEARAFVAATKNPVLTKPVAASELQQTLAKVIEG